MADRVHNVLERMLPELEDLEKRGLFSRKEVRAIASRRTDFEYMIKRVNPLKSDFERYIEYELQLERLRTIKKKKIISSRKWKASKWRKSISDWACGGRVAYIYTRALRKFKGDMSLWLKFLEFCRKKNLRKNMQEAITRILQLHSTKPAVWIYAAAWEFEKNMNVTAARVLMQRGLRMCPKSEELWLEYIRMEMTNAKKVKLRRLVLGLDKPSSTEDKNEDANLKSSETVTDNTASLHSELLTESLNPSVKDNSVSAMVADVVLTVYKNAIASIPDSLSFRYRVLEMLIGETSSELDEVIDEIYDGIKKDFSKEPLAWNLLARHAFNKSIKKQVQKDVSGMKKVEDDYLKPLKVASKVYEEGLRLSPSMKLFELYEKFLASALQSASMATEQEEGEETEIEKQKKLSSKITDDLLSLYDWSLASNMSSDSMKERHLSLLLRCGQVDEARQLAVALCGGKSSISSRVWSVKIILENDKNDVFMNDGHDDDDNRGRKKGNVRSAMEKAMKFVPFENSMPLWTVVLPLMYKENESLDECIQFVEYYLAFNSGKKTSHKLACWAIDFVFRIGGYDYAKKACDRFLALPGPSMELFQKCLEIESLTTFDQTDECSTHSNSNSNSNSNLRSRFESAITHHGKTNPDLWIQYCKSEIMFGNFDAANAIFWRAKKQLRNPSSFMQTYNKMLSEQL